MYIYIYIKKAEVTSDRVTALVGVRSFFRGPEITRQNIPSSPEVATCEVIWVNDNLLGSCAPGGFQRMLRN